MQNKMAERAGEFGNAYKLANQVSPAIPGFLNHHRLAEAVLLSDRARKVLEKPNSIGDLAFFSVI